MSPSCGSIQQRLQRHVVIELLCIVADPRRGPRDVRTLSVQFLSFSHSFQQRFCQTIGWYVLFGVGMPPLSATAMTCHGLCRNHDQCSTGLQVVEKEKGPLVHSSSIQSTDSSSGTETKRAVRFEEVSQKLLCQIAVADLRGARDASPPQGSKFINCKQFWGKFDKIICWRPPPQGWRPHLGKILDPPLNCAQFYSVMKTCHILTWNITWAITFRHPPPARLLNLPPGCGPRDLQCMLGYHTPPPWTASQTDTYKNITFANFVCGW